MNANRISVVTVCYNAVSVIEKTIISVITQDYPNIEYIIIDGASKDGTIEVIQRYSEYISYWISEPDNGIYDAMNKGIRHAHGDWIIFLNAGDFFHSNNIFSSLIQQINDDTIIAYGLIRYFTSDYEFDMKYIPIEKMAYLDPIPHPATLIKLPYHKEHLFDITFKSSGDYDFFYKAYYDDKVKFQFIPVIVTDFDNSVGISKDNINLIWKENKRVWSRYASLSIKIMMYRDRIISLTKQTIKNVIKYIK